MNTPLGFSVWRDDDGFYAPGTVAKLFDGELVSLLHKAKNYIADTGKEISAINFKITMEHGGNVVAEHSFKLDKMTSIWLIVDPADSDENPSFTPTFIKQFANLPEGEHNFTVKFFGDDDLFNEGQLVYKSDGQNTAYKELLPKFDNIAGTREQANKAFQEESAMQDAEEERKKQAEREFNVKIINTDSGHTKYVVETNQTTRSENIHQITPMNTLTLNLFRGSTFELKYYDQDTTKENTTFVAMVDETCHNNEYIVK